MWCEDRDNLFDALTQTVLNSGYIAKPTPVNVTDYRGQLMLLPGEHVGGRAGRRVRGRVGGRVGMRRRVPFHRNRYGSG